MGEMISLVALAVFVLLMFAAAAWIRARERYSTKHGYIYDNRNPYTRRCAECGAEENLFGYPLGYSQWEPVGRLCECKPGEVGR